MLQLTFGASNTVCMALAHELQKLDNFYQLKLLLIKLMC